MDAKAVAAWKAVLLIEDGMTIGLGSGSTASIAIQYIGDRISKEGIHVVGVPTSSTTIALAEKMGIPLVELTSGSVIDLTIDGADEIDSELHLIKGGGGALVREKIVAVASREVVIICDDSKIKEELGAFPLPVAVVPFGWQVTRDHLLGLCPTVTLRMRPGRNDPYVTDDGNYILDCHLGCIPDPATTEKKFRSVVGVVDVGLFIDVASRVIIGSADGTYEERFPTQGIEV